jgi:hypothetical protein
MKSSTLFYILVAGLLTIPALGFAVPVDGYCFLQNQSNHAGIKVLFDAVSPGALTDSALTDMSGHYQKDVNIGVYNVLFHRLGYGGEALYQRMFSTPTTLPNAALPDIPEGICISGALSGTLIDTTYIVEGGIWVRRDDSLVINPGAQFYFLCEGTNSYGFMVSGNLTAIGTEQDSIRFLSAPGYSGWSGIELDSASRATIEYCTFSDVFGGGAISSNMYSFNSSNPVLTVSHCTFYEYGVRYGGAIYFECRGICHISDCTILGNDSALGWGIYCFAPCSFDVRYCTIDQMSCGIYLNRSYYGDPIEIANCLVRGSNDCGIVVSEADPIICNCTITANSTGIGCFKSSFAAVNDIICGNDIGIENYMGDVTLVSFCDFTNNRTKNFYGSLFPQYLGQVITVNNNGDSCDTYMNIFLDPMFVNPHGDDYHLQSNSPCIDAGDPNSPLDPDGTIADIGAFYFNQLGVIDNRHGAQPPSTFRLLPCYPNPFNSTLAIPFTIPIQGNVQIAIYNLIGQKVYQQNLSMLSLGIHQIQWNANSYASGLYFIQLISNHGESQQKVLLLK